MILPLGLTCVQRIANIRQQYGLKDLFIVGIGGVTEPEDALRYIDCGADVVQAATVFFSDPYFASRVRTLMDLRWPTVEAKLRLIKDAAVKNWSRAWDSLKIHHSHQDEILRGAANDCWKSYEEELQPGRVAAARSLSAAPGIEEFRVKILNLMVSSKALVRK